MGVKRIAQERKGYGCKLRAEFKGILHEATTEKGLKIGRDRPFRLFLAARTMLASVARRLSKNFRELAEVENQMNRMSVIPCQHCRQNTSTLWQKFTHSGLRCETQKSAKRGRRNTLK